MLWIRTSRGHRAYVAPELLNGCAPTPRSDVFSLGVTLYYVLMGVHPFSTIDSLPTNENVLLGKCVRPRELKPEIPRRLEAICLKAMSLDPDERYQTAGEMQSELENFLAGRVVRAGGISTRLVSGMLEVRSKPFTAAAVSVVLLLTFLIFGQWWVLSRQDGKLASGEIIQQQQDDAIDELQTTLAFFLEQLVKSPSDVGTGQKTTYSPAQIKMLFHHLGIFQQLPRSPESTKSVARSLVLLAGYAYEAQDRKLSRQCANQAIVWLDELSGSAGQLTVEEQNSYFECYLQLAKLHVHDRNYGEAMPYLAKAEQAGLEWGFDLRTVRLERAKILIQRKSYSRAAEQLLSLERDSIANDNRTSLSIIQLLNRLESCDAAVGMPIGTREVPGGGFTARATFTGDHREKIWKGARYSSWSRELLCAAP